MSHGVLITATTLLERLQLFCEGVIKDVGCDLFLLCVFKLKKFNHGEIVVYVFTQCFPVYLYLHRVVKR